jgi:hypothetical protein
MVAIVKEAGTTYNLEREREGKRKEVRSLL